LKTYTFDSQIELGETLRDFTQDEVKSEPMFFRAAFGFATINGGQITRAFLSHLPDWFKDAEDFTFDSRVHMLMPGWYPCIPGFHHDDVPRTRSDKQPNYDTPEYKSEHAMALIGDCCPTEFALGTSNFPEVLHNEIVYKHWHPHVVEQIKSGKLESFSAPSNKIIYFDWNTWHQGTKAIKRGFRWFGRASINTNRIPLNEIRVNANVYMDEPMEGW